MWRLRFQELLLTGLLALGAREALAHGPGGHQECAGDSAKPCVGAENQANKATGDGFQARIHAINRRYVEHVKPIFVEKCGDCHSSRIHYPWYYPVPGVRQLIDRDHREAMKHLDFSSDFPFGGHGSPKEDLRAIQESLRKDSMPPFRYRALHWKSKLTAEEKRIVTEWAASGELLLSK